MTTDPQTHPDDPTGHPLYNADGSTHTEALVALLTGQNPDLVIVRRADLAEVWSAALLPAECDDEDWDDPAQAEAARAAQARIETHARLPKGDRTT